jgi:hypothetical protein
MSDIVDCEMCICVILVVCYVMGTPVNLSKLIKLIWDDMVTWLVGHHLVMHFESHNLCDNLMNSYVGLTYRGRYMVFLGI